MLTQLWKRGLATVGLGLVAMTGNVFAQEDDAAPAPRAEAARAEGGDKDLPGPIDSAQDLQDTVKMLFKMADTNNNGQISQKEATDAGNLLVGGFFFRADANGDGVIGQEEAKAARDSLLRQQPLLRVVLERAKGGEGEDKRGSNPAQGLAAFLDGNGDKKLQATELRQAVQTGVQGMFAAADTNRDGQMTPNELNAAAVGLANTAAQAAFQAADTDHNGALSQAEFDKSIQAPMHLLFRVVDANGDGQITPQESQAAQRAIVSQIRMLQVEGNQGGPAPTPAFSAPRTPSRTTPAPATTPAPPQQ